MRNYLCSFSRKNTSASYHKKGSRCGYEQCLPDPRPQSIASASDLALRRAPGRRSTIRNSRPANLSALALRRRLNRDVLERLAGRIIHAPDEGGEVHHGVRNHVAAHAAAVRAQRSGRGLRQQLLGAGELRDAVRDGDGQVEDAVEVAAVEPEALVDRDVVFSARRRANFLLAVADEAVGPLEVDVLDGLSRLLVHDVGERGCRGRDVGYREVLEERVAGEEHGEVEHLGEGVADVLRRYWEFPVSGDVYGDV